LGDFHPVADADLGADSALEVVKVVEHAHLAAPVVRLKPATSNCHFRHRGRDDEFGLGIGNHLATLTLGAVSIRLALPLGNPITAISVTTRSIVLADVSGRSHAMTILDLPLATWGEFFTAETSC
jgi:hypothetical protein